MRRSACTGCLIVATASAAAPWSHPVAVPGWTGQAGAAETVSAPAQFISNPGAGFDFVTNQLLVAWRAPQPAASSSIQVATRRAPST
jgi:hypothetical protein